ncbi:MAG TPA: hypothetical protein VKX46_15005 [Ktedonobacteraceae bacterium]|jgi:hypothetical protein|nr:hypothetical protein [Ktedonobacteraceae bacterium]
MIRTFSWRTHLWTAIGLFVFLLAGMANGSHSVYAASTTSGRSTSPAWRTFHDPVYGFSLSYPANWILTSERDGSNITLLNPATQTTLSPIVTTQTETPATLLKRDSLVAGTKTRIVAGHQAIDKLSPYVPASKAKTRLPGHDAAAPEPLQTRTVTLPVANASGTTNVYTFMLTQPTDATGKVSAAVQADSATFEKILDSFTLPAKVNALARSASTSVAGCDRVCWADANWNYTKYDDTSSIYCDMNGYSGGYYSASCSDGNTMSGVQVPGGGPGAGNGNEYYQPNFQCADFVARALTQDGLVPGLNNGGVYGSSPATNSIGSPSYQSGNSTGYNLIYVPTLDNYLINSGLGTNIGTNVSQAAPGDVIIYYDSSGDYHTMLITSAPFQSGSTWEVYLDGHNASAYHNLLTYWTSANPSFKIIHLKSSAGGSNNISQQDVFTVGANGHLIDAHWSLGGNWSYSDLGAPGGTTLTGTPSADTFTVNGTAYQHVLVLGANGHLYEYWQFLGQGWALNDLNAKAAPPAGVNFVGSPSSFSYVYSGLTYHSVSVLGSDGNLYNYSWNQSSPNTWTLNNLGSPSGSYGLASSPSGNAFFANGTLYQHIEVVGNNNELYEYWQFVGGSWEINDLNTLAAPPQYVNFVGSPTGFTYVSNNTPYHSIFVLGSNNHLYNYTSAVGGSWTLTDVSVGLTPAGVTLTGTPSADAFVANGALMQHAEMVGSNGHLYEFWEDGGGSWEINDLSAKAGTSAVVTSSPWGLTYTLQGQTIVHHSIYVITSDGHLQEFYWSSNASGSWSLYDHGLPSGTSFTANSPTSTAY